MQQNTPRFFMQQAIIEGRKALPHCLPNPPVGCVVVKDHKIIARGFTNPPGQDHAEAMALRLVPNDLTDLELYVTLEPCSFQGKTPSCARAIVNKKIKKVYVGIIDPHPKNQGEGIRILKEAGIDIELGLLAEEINEELSQHLIT